ncbi:MAG: hypothetical protein JXR73_13545 [Candidatus Omnitrophica bacterium]|nr:hypothetical protein [Candidatus Omnitrophota bacterium]
MEFTPDTYIRLALGLGLFAFGWTLFRFGLHAAGFILGYVFGTSAYELLVAWLIRLHEMDVIGEKWLEFIPQHPYATFFAGCVFGIVGVLLAKKMYQVMIFLGATAGALFVLYTDENQKALLDRLLDWLGVLVPLNNTLGQAWPAVLALLIGLLFLLFQKKLIILLTACMGAYILSDAIQIPILFLPLCFIGFLLQTVKRPKQKKEAEE